LPQFALHSNRRSWDGTDRWGLDGLITPWLDGAKVPTIRHATRSLDPHDDSAPSIPTVMGRNSTLISYTFPTVVKMPRGRPNIPQICLGSPLLTLPADVQLHILRNLDDQTLLTALKLSLASKAYLSWAACILEGSTSISGSRYAAACQQFPVSITARRRQVRPTKPAAALPPSILIPKPRQESPHRCRLNELRCLFLQRYATSMPRLRCYCMLYRGVCPRCIQASQRPGHSGRHYTANCTISLRAAQLNIMREFP
jgi:hypothetical protein